ncbi:MAG TPA: hypothetical protein VM305_08430 [Candidatus Limnocylindrales bacterium]|nr:hypothetical protein [Candidatus Limnocylindrales bacterium]
MILTLADRARAQRDAHPLLFSIALSLLLALIGYWLAGAAGVALGALTLVEAAKLSQTDLQRGVVETFILESSVLDRLPLLPIEGNAYAYNEEGTLPGVEFRAVNSAYSESTGTVNQKTESLVILGGDADVDTFIAKTRGNLNDQRATQTRMKVKAARIKYQDSFINGDVAVDANSFDGLKKRLTGTQVVDAATNGLGMIGASDNDRHAFLEILDEALSRVAGGADAIYANARFVGKLRSVARRIGGWSSYTMADFGKVIETYNGIPILDIGKRADGTEIIPNDEVQGTADDTTSIYAVKFGEDETDGGVTGLFNGPAAVFDVRDLGEIDSKPVFRTRIEGFLGLAVFGKGAVRLRGIRANA